MVKTNKRAFKQPGFTFGAGEIFESRQTTENVYHAMIGANANNSDADLTTFKQIVSSSVENLFNVGLKQIDVYKATRGGAQFFKMIAEEFDAMAPLEPQDIEEIFRAYIAARERYRASVRDTPLVALVDRFREAVNGVRSAGPSTSVELVYRPSAADRAQMELLAAFDDLRISEDAPQPSVSSSAEAPWPPTYFNLQEKIWLCDSSIRWQLYGTGQMQPSDASDIPTLPDRYSHPIDVKLYLAWLALTNYSPTLSDWGLYMSPIGFLDAEDRKDWYLATGGASRRYSTIEEFITYAKGLFNTRPAQNCERFGVVLVLRKVKEGYWLVFYDPIFTNLKATGQQPTHGLGFKMRAARQIAASFPLVWLFHGGKLYNPLANLGFVLKDPMQFCAAFLWDLAHNKVPETAEGLKEWRFEQQKMSKPSEWKQ
ncbi:hypothetical protein DL765_003573 [Monosporascus sp. GIB2]|nr:hypothetical protein DL765_003573 [Monosporascus sp. GIB2]